MRRQSDFRRATLVTHATNDVDVTTRTMLCRSTAISTERVARVHGQHRNVRNGGQGTGVLPSPMAARQSTINNIIVSDEAILNAENGGKPLGGRGSAPKPAGRAHSAPPQTPSWWGGGLLLLPRNPTPRCQPSDLAPNQKSWTSPWDSLGGGYNCDSTLIRRRSL